jgi:hypothetical protein
MRPAATLAVLALLLGGCGVADDRDQAGDVTARFFADLRSRDGAAACRLVSSGLRQQIEKQGPCDEEVISLKLTGRRAARVQVFVTEAKADVEGGDSVFLTRERAGWRLSALGCKPKTEDEPFDCQEES